MKSDIEKELGRLRKAHEVLRARTRALLDANPDMIFRMDREGRYLDFHVAEEDTLAMRPSEFLGRKHSDIFEPKFSEACMRSIAQALDTGLIQVMEYPLEVRNETREYESRIVPASDDEVVVIIRDVTENKRAVDQLRLTEFRLNEAQRVARIGSWERDLVTNEVWWSPEIYRLLEVEPDESGPSFAVFFNRVHPDDRANVLARVTEAERSGEPYVSYHRVVLPSGTVRTFYDRAFVVFDTAGRPARLVGTVQDISEQAELEHEMVALEVSKRQTPAQREQSAQRRSDKDGYEGLGHALTAVSLGLAALAERLAQDRVEQQQAIERLELLVRGQGQNQPASASADGKLRGRLRRRGPAESGEGRTRRPRSAR